jgi:hypothetical protein
MKKTRLRMAPRPTRGLGDGSSEERAAAGGLFFRCPPWYVLQKALRFGCPASHNRKSVEVML